MGLEMGLDAEQLRITLYEFKLSNAFFMRSRKHGQEDDRREEKTYSYAFRQPTHQDGAERVFTYPS
jgi:hypothetical protein